MENKKVSDEIQVEKEKKNVLVEKKKENVDDKTKKLENKLNKMKIEEEKEKEIEEDSQPHEEISENQENSGEPACSFCSKPNPTKRCVKRHPRCLKKLFCNETCESMAHKKTADAKNAVAKKKPEAGKKKKGKKGDKPSGEFWWNNTVYASW